MQGVAPFKPKLLPGWLDEGKMMMKNEIMMMNCWVKLDVYGAWFEGLTKDCCESDWVWDDFVLSMNVCQGKGVYVEVMIIKVCAKVIGCGPEWK